MLPRHSRNLERRFPLIGTDRTLNIYQNILKEIKIRDSGEGFIVTFLGSEMVFGVGGGYDREIAAEGGFDSLVEVVAEMDDEFRERIVD